jgi:hypothetical protein
MIARSLRNFARRHRHIVSSQSLSPPPADVLVVLVIVVVADMAVVGGGGRGDDGGGGGGGVEGADDATWRRRRRRLSRRGRIAEERCGVVRVEKEEAEERGEENGYANLLNLGFGVCFLRWNETTT